MNKNEVALNVGNYIMAQCVNRGRLMTEAEMRLGVSLMLGERGPAEELDVLHEDALKSVPIYAITTKRLEAMTNGSVTLSVTGGLLMAEIAGGNPGNAVLFAATAFAFAKQTELTSVGVNDIMASMFPMGFPTKEILREAWDMQKGINGADNALDHNWAWLDHQI